MKQRHSALAIDDLFRSDFPTGLSTIIEDPASQPRLNGAESSLIGGIDRSHQFSKIADDVRAFDLLSHGWDLYGGGTPDQISIAIALRILQYALARTDLPAPSVSPISTGVFIEWQLPGMRLYFEIDCDSVLYELSDGQSKLDGECQHDDLPVLFGIIDKAAQDVYLTECV